MHTLKEKAPCDHCDIYISGDTLFLNKQDTCNYCHTHDLMAAIAMRINDPDGNKLIPLVQ